MKLYASIEKVTPQDDGTIKVYGYASSGAVDADGETITPAAMRAAIPDYMKFGAVREMHQKSAAGTAIEVRVEDDGRTFFGAHVVDPIAVKKVTTSVYKGFSIGGNITARDKDDATKITGIRLIEVSLVDRPANPEAVFTMYKSEDIAPTDAEAIEAIATMMNEKAISPVALLKAAQAAIAPPLEPVKAGALKKGMDGLQMFATVLSAVACMANDAASEATWEADGSPLPAQLKAWLTTGVQIFETMATEETSELIASLMPAPASTESAGSQNDLTGRAGDIIPIAAAATAEVEKTESLATDPPPADPLSATEAALAPPASDPAIPVVEKIEAAPADASVALVKAELAKRDETIEKLLGRVESLAAEITKLNQQPLPGKALLRSIAKGEDISHSDPALEPEPVRKTDGTPDEAATLIKSIHARGGMTLRF